MKVSFTVPTLQIELLRYKQAKSFAQGHRGKQWILGSIPGPNSPRMTQRELLLLQSPETSTILRDVMLVNQDSSEEDTHPGHVGPLKLLCLCQKRGQARFQTHSYLSGTSQTPQSLWLRSRDFTVRHLLERAFLLSVACIISVLHGLSQNTEQGEVGFISIDARNPGVETECLRASR